MTWTNQATQNQHDISDNAEPLQAHSTTANPHQAMHSALPAWPYRHPASGRPSSIQQQLTRLGWAGNAILSTTR